MTKVPPTRHILVHGPDRTAWGWTIQKFAALQVLGRSLEGQLAMENKNRTIVDFAWFGGQGSSGQRSIAGFDKPVGALAQTGGDQGTVAVLEDHRPVASGHRGIRALRSGDSEGDVLQPFQWKELVARVCQYLRDFHPQGPMVWLEDVCVDFGTREARRSSGEFITLTNQEFKTLRCFFQNPRRALSREELLNQAWGYENYPTTRTVDNHVLKLRQKFERNPARPIHFLTVHGVGYKFVP